MLAPTYRIVAACVTGYSAFSLWQAYRTGVVFNYRKMLDRNVQPQAFVATVMSHVFGGLYFAWCAFGGDTQALHDFIGHIVPFTRP